MAISFTAAPSYFWLNSWILVNIIDLSTQRFCDRFVDYKIDPCHRLYDQMAMAARSIRANIAEGSGRHETSFETEMRLTDVARGSAHELMGYFVNFMMRGGMNAWPAADRRFQSVKALQLAKPEYGDDFIADAMRHIQSQKARFDCFLERGTAEDAANCLIVLNIKIIVMLTRMLEAQLRDFKKQGGFAENMTQERLGARREQSSSEGAPECPECGKPMLRRSIQRGIKQGEQFWGCSDYPRCRGARDLRPSDKPSK